MWDVTEPIPKKKSYPTKVYSCKPEKLFTIKEGKIVELKNENDLKEKVVASSKKSLPFISIDAEKEADSEIRARLSEDEIRKIPKFHNYEKGMPSNVLLFFNKYFHKINNH